jgi:8-oxo-dGTP diphosphatase
MKIHKRGTLIVIYNSAMEYLLQKRDHNPGIKYPGTWVFLGGGVKKGESPEDAIKRELYEEIGFSLSDPEWYGEFHYSDEEEEHLQYVFCKKLDLDVSRLTLREGDALKYLSWQDAQSLEFGFNIKTILLDYHNKRHFLEKPSQPGERL